MYELIPLFGMVFSFVAVIAIVLIVSRSRVRRLEIQAELQGKLIERFGSAPELIAFLQSSAGRQFVTGVQRSNTVFTRERAAGGFRVGIIFSALGLGFLTLMLITGIEGLAYPGVLLLVMGLAYLIATWATMRLAPEQNGNATLPSQPPTTTTL